MVISILLATYNSGRYLNAQIDSILGQSSLKWKLYIRDDGSSDETLNIINGYINKYPEKIVLVKDDKGSLKSYHNFVELLRVVDSDYYMFCDHDDVWLPEKIESSINEMRYVETRHPNKPVIIHSDMNVVDQNLNVISGSFWKYSRLLPNRCSFMDLACCNCVNGCTMLINRKAKEVSLPNVDYCLMHDALVAQSVAANHGIIVAIKQPLVLYRQHIDNVIGAADVKKGFFWHRILHFMSAMSDNIGIWKRARHIQRMSLIRFLIHKAKISKLRYQVA